MRTAPPSLLPLLRSQVQGDLLALVYLHPEEEFSLSDLAQLLEASLSGVHREVKRLTAAGLLHDRRVGTSRLVRAVVSSPLTQPLTDLLAVTYGPRPVLTEALSMVPGVVRAFIYGSWAARYAGEPGPPPGDIDVLVVGTADAADLDQVAEEAERVLRREVNIRRISPERWEQADDPFLRTVRDRPLVGLQVRTAGPPDGPVRGHGAGVDPREPDVTT